MRKIKAVASLLLAVLLVFGAAVSLLPADVLPVTEAEAASPGTWIASWSTAAVDGTISLDNYISGLKFNDFIPARSVIRIETQLSAGGTYSRFRFSNEYGTSALKLDAVSVALTDSPGTARIHADTATPITFNDGQASVTVQPGEVIWSDTVYFPTDPLAYVSVTMFVPNTTYIKTAGLYGGRTYLKVASSTDAVDDTSLPMASEVNIASGTITYHTTPFLTGIDVRADYSDGFSVVFIGDSTLTNEVHHYFAQRAYASGYSHVGFVNNSIVANRLLYDGVGLIGNLYGKAVIDRFKRDALDITGCEVILVKIGLNDILHPMTESMKGVAPYASVDDIINGYKQLISAAHAAGKKIYFFTKSAWNGYERSFLGQSGDLSWTQEAQALCDQLDAWIKSTNLIDGYFDMAPLSSPVDSTSLLPAFTTDGAHLTSLGAVAMADLISPRVIGTSSLQTAAAINNVDPYESVDEVISAYYATSANATTTTKKNNNNTATTTKKNNGNTVQNTTTVNDALAESVLASREQAANAANRNPQSPNVPTTAATTTKANTNNNNNNKTNNTTTTTKAASTTKANATTTTKAAATTKPASTTANASAVASSIQESLSNAQTNTTAAATQAQPTAEPAGDATYADTALMNTTAAENYYSVSVDVLNNGEAGTVAAEPPVVAEQLSGNGTVIGVVMVIILVGMVVAAVIITMKTKRRSDME